MILKMSLENGKNTKKNNLQLSLVIKHKHTHAHTESQAKHKDKSIKLQQVAKPETSYNLAVAKCNERVRERLGTRLCVSLNLISKLSQP